MRKRNKSRTSNWQHHDKMSKKLNRELQSVFRKLSDEFITKITNEGIDYESDKMAEVFEHFDKRWRAWARKWIASKQGILDYSKSESRVALTGSFTNFIQNLVTGTKEEIENRKKEGQKESRSTPVEKEGMVLINNINYKIDEVQELMGKSGIKTQAKTSKGLRQALDKTTEKNRQVFYGLLSEF